ncbi:hypothetical protein HYH03_007433 [Edaphochlamys debaryana]|uniref:F-box domain-containing protein n=1 Tax=Edaphochlamys debaryana TaxID=47281 RepID=A0A835Y574_9CHLO|nr:hypothetical protein HYH03_007433 [Edaphochlamys debaryana]|eukprot:KAG2494376.1 hypothetical protein HYH03_007433 [Edaphochlamys debaryana]
MSVDTDAGDVDAEPGGEQAEQASTSPGAGQPLSCSLPSASTIGCLPCGALAHIFSTLGPRDLACAAGVCRSWRRLVALEAAANKLWRSFYAARWHPSGAHGRSSGPATSGPWRAPACSPLSCSPSPSPPTAPSLRSAALSSSAPGGQGEVRWSSAYGAKMLRLRSWSGRYSADQMVGHRSAVRAVRLIPSHNLLATASLDRTVRLWDLGSGLPLAASRPHGGTVRCLAADPSLIASGCSDALVRIWQPPSAHESALPLYDIAAKPYQLKGHTGPVSCLALDDGTVFSGSWDCTVRIWRQNPDATADAPATGAARASATDDDGADDVGTAGAGMFGSPSSLDEAGGGAASSVGSIRRGGADPDPAASDQAGGWSCTGVLGYGDWVYCCAVRGGNLLVAAGNEVVVTDAATGRAVRRFAGLHDGGAVSAVEGCRSGKLLFTAAGDGLLLAHDLRMKQGSRVLWHHNAAVTGLAFEDPWLASASADGCIMLQETERVLAGGSPPPRSLHSACRALHCPPGQPALCLDLADQRLAAGTDSGVVRLWDFTGAEAAAERASASRAARAASKAARSSRQHLSPPPPPLPYAPQPQPCQQPYRGRPAAVPIPIPAPRGATSGAGPSSSAAPVFGSSPGHAPFHRGPFAGASAGGASGGSPGSDWGMPVMAGMDAAAAEGSPGAADYGRRGSGGGGGSHRRRRGKGHQSRAHPQGASQHPQGGGGGGGGGNPNYHSQPRPHAHNQHNHHHGGQKLGPVAPPPPPPPAFRYVASGPPAAGGGGGGRPQLSGYGPKGGAGGLGGPFGGPGGGGSARGGGSTPGGSSSRGGSSRGGRQS